MSRPTFRILSTASEISNTGLSPSTAKLPSLFFYLSDYHILAPARSLATTCAISVDFFSSGYLDGSGFRFCFTPLPGFFSPFPHGTGSLSVDDEYLALEDGPPIFRQDFTCPALLFVRLVPPLRFRIRDYHPLWSSFPACSSISTVITYRLLRVRSPLLAESRLISFPPGT